MLPSFVRSSPTRGTWIEISDALDAKTLCHVVPHAGDVDRNARRCRMAAMTKVVPHAGDVDRNIDTEGGTKRLNVSSPTRGTWIEISSR